jgi:hypothetical protein
VFICVKNYIDCRELWADEDFEMTAIEVKGKDPNFTWEIVGIYRAPNDDMQVMERLAAQTGCTGNSTKRSINGGDLNLPCVDRNGLAGGNSGTQAFINSLVWKDGSLRGEVAQPEGMHCWMFTLSDPKVRSSLAVSFRGSVIIKG